MLKSRTNTENKSSRAAKKKMRKTNTFIKMCSGGSIKSKFIKEQDSSALLLGPNSLLNNIPILGASFY